MIVRYNNTDYLVLSIYMYEYHNMHSEYDNFVSCVSVNNSELYHFKLRDVSVIDGKVQDNVCLDRFTKHDCSYSLVRITGNVIAEYTKHNADDFYLDEFHTDVVSNDYKASKVFYEYINSVRMFHGLHRYDLSFIESYKTEDDKESPTEEERRAKALETELEEYLRLGEEVENSD